MPNYAQDKDSRRSHTSRDGGSVPRVSPITAPGSGEKLLDFQSTRPLSASAKAALDQAFESGWFEPQKLHQGSARLRNLLQEARESIASILKVDSESLEFVGELGFGYWAVLAGSLKDFSGTFIYGETDRQVVHAFARERQESGGATRLAKVDRSGKLSYEKALADGIPNNPYVLFWQATNRETGVVQELPNLEVSPNSLLIADMTASYQLDRFPRDCDVSLWDPRVIGGPEGISIISIRPGSRWRSPIPPIDKRRLFGSFSKPLLLLTAVAIEGWAKSADSELTQLRKLNRELRERIMKQIKDVEIVADPANQDPRYLALVAKGVAAEEILRQVEKRGVLIDAGSACGAGAISPSHVLEAMGFGESGHLRITIKPEHSVNEIERLVVALNEEIERFRSTN